jgi:hypothetical protein
MAFCSSFDNEISSVAIEQSSAEYVLATGMLVADVLVLANDCYINIINVNVALSAPSFFMRELKIRTHRSRKYRKIMHVKHNQHKLLILTHLKKKLFCCL